MSDIKYVIFLKNIEKGEMAEASFELVFCIMPWCAEHPRKIQNTPEDTMSLVWTWRPWVPPAVLKEGVHIFFTFWRNPCIQVSFG